MSHDDFRDGPLPPVTGEQGADPPPSASDGGARTLEMPVLGAAGALPRCRLQVTGGPHAGQVQVLDGEVVRVGTHASNDLVLEHDRTVSRHHLEIRYTQLGYLLVDLGSTNGTYLEGRRVERTYLPPGSTLRLGASTLAFSPLEEEPALEPDGEVALCGMVGQSAQMRRIFGLIRRVAPREVPVVVGGETGTGKELVARAVHQLSPRASGPLVVLDCGSIAPELIESELFGHEKGAFTGAHAARPGAFERAHGGTIFLDELGELRLDLQPKLLRVLESGEVRRVGGSDVLHVDCRVVAATHRDLGRMVAEGRFREDLYFRLNVIRLELPPLRSRCEDIPLILARALEGAEGVPRRFSPEALALLQAYPWPGNVRELLNVLGHVATFCEGDEVLPEHLPARIIVPQQDGPLVLQDRLPFKDAKEQLLESFEREYSASVLRRCEGNLSRAARESGLHRKSIERLVKKYGLDAKSMKPS